MNWLRKSFEADWKPVPAKDDAGNPAAKKMKCAGGVPRTTEASFLADSDEEEEDDGVAFYDTNKLGT